MSEKQNESDGYTYSKPPDLPIEPMLQANPFIGGRPLFEHFDADARRLDATDPAHACAQPGVQSTPGAAYDVSAPPTPLPTPQAHPTPGPFHLNGSASEVTRMEVFTRLVCNAGAQQEGGQHAVVKISYENAPPNYVGFFPQGGAPSSGHARAFVETHDQEEAIAHNRDMFTRIEVPGTRHDVRLLAGRLMDQWKSYNAHPENALYYSFTGQPNFNSNGFLAASFKGAAAPDDFVAKITHGPLNVDAQNAETIGVKVFVNANFNGTASISGAAHMPSRSQMWGYGPVNHPQQSFLDKGVDAAVLAPSMEQYYRDLVKYTVVKDRQELTSSLVEGTRKAHDMISGTTGFLRNAFNPEALRADFAAAIEKAIMLGEKRAASPLLHKNAVRWDGKTPHQGTISAIRDDVLELKVGKDKYIHYRFEEPFNPLKDHGLKIGQELHIRGDGMLMEPHGQKQGHGLGLRHGRR